MRAVCIAAIALIGASGCSLILGDDGGATDAGPPAADAAPVGEECGKADLLSDGFDAENRQWFVGSDAQSTVTVASGQLSLAVQGMPGNEASLTSRFAYDLRDAAVLVEFGSISKTSSLQTTIALRTQEGVGPGSLESKLLLRWNETTVEFIEELPGSQPNTHATQVRPVQGEHLVWRISEADGRIILESGPSADDLSVVAEPLIELDSSALEVRFGLFAAALTGPDGTVVRSINVPQQAGAFCAVQSARDDFDAAEISSAWAAAVIPASCTLSPGSGQVEVVAPPGGARCGLASVHAYRFDQGSIAVDFKGVSTTPGDQTMFELLSDETIGDGIRIAVEPPNLVGEFRDVDNNDIRVSRPLGTATDIRVRIRIGRLSSEVIFLEWSEDGGPFTELASAPLGFVPEAPLRVFLGVLGGGAIGRFDNFAADPPP